MWNIGTPELLIVVVLLAFTVLPLWGIVDAAVRPDSQWATASQSKTLWVVLQFLLGPLGAILYFTTIRPKLKAVE